MGFPSPVCIFPTDWGRFSAFCAFWRPRSLAKLRTGDTSPSDPGRFTFGPATLPFRPALNPVLCRIVVKIRLRPALNSVLRCIVVKIRLRPALNPVLRRIVVKIRLRPALNPVLRRIVVKSQSDRCTYGVCAPCGRRRRGRDGRKKSGRRLVTLGRWWAVLDSNQ